MTSLARLTLLKSKAYLNETSDTNNDVLKNVLIAVSAGVEMYCNRALISTTYTDEFQTRLAFSPNIIYPLQYPVTSVTTLKFWDSTTDEYVEEDSDYYLLVTRGDNSYIQYPKLGQAVNATYAEFPSGLNEIKMTYVAGYLNTDWDTALVTASFGVPAELEKAVCSLAQLAYNDGMGGKGRLGITNVSTGAMGVTKEIFDTGSMPDNIRVVLDKYRKAVV